MLGLTARLLYCTICCWATDKLTASPSISVAVCTCNGARFIEEQIDSICAQTLPVAELVVHDDASDDDTVARVYAAWARWHERQPHQVPVLRIVVHQVRLGVAQNFAGALNDCTGEWLVMCDQDDRWHPERIALLVARLAAQPSTLLLHGNAHLIDGDGVPLGHTLFEALAVSIEELNAVRSGRAVGVFMARNLVTGAATIFHRSLWAMARPIPAHWLHDEWIGMVAAVQSVIDLETRALLDYRQHGGNQIGAQKPRLGEEFLRAFEARGDWHLVKLYRARELQQRLPSLIAEPPAALVDAIHAKVTHHLVRVSYPRNRAIRWLPALREWFTGRYGLFGRGVRGLIKDLVEAR